MQILIAILALSVLVIVHELGHFTVAKLSGVKVHEFSLFMGPKLFGFKRGETDYSVRLIPLGGFVRMEGEEQASEDERAFNNKPVWIRTLIIAAGPVANLIIALVFLLIINLSIGHSTNIISDVQPGYAAAEAGLQKGDQIIGYDGKRVFSDMDISLFMYGTKGEPIDFSVRRGETTIPVKLKPTRLTQYIIGINAIDRPGRDSRRVEEVVEGNPADKAGMKPGDIITRLNNTEVSSFSDIKSFFAANKEEKVKVTVKRGNEEIVMDIKPQKAESYVLGAAFSWKNGGILDSLSSSATTAITDARTVYYSLAWLIKGKVSPSQMSGPVGIVSFIGSAVETGPTIGIRLLNLLSISALLSINLGLFNLLPIPALDGSKLLLLGIEKIRRKALPPEREAFISMIGFVLLIMLMLFATYNDILRLIGIG